MAYDKACPANPGKVKYHAFRDVSRTRLPKGDKRGDWHVKEKCKHCGMVREYNCINA